MKLYLLQLKLPLIIHKEGAPEALSCRTAWLEIYQQWKNKQGAKKSRTTASIRHKLCQTDGTARENDPLSSRLDVLLFCSMCVTLEFTQ